MKIYIIIFNRLNNDFCSIIRGIYGMEYMVQPLHFHFYSAVLVKIVYLCDLL